MNRSTPGRPPSVEQMAKSFQASPFTRLARAHAFSMAGDALVALALAGSLFFSIRPDAARAKIALYLALTMAPFALVGPFIGPAIDRMPGGHRLMVMFSNLARLVAALLMIGNINNTWLFPLAFVQLVSSKSYAVAKGALVPSTVTDDAELVEANSKLALLSGAVGFAVAIPALPLLALDQARLVVVLASMAFGAALVLSLKLPKVKTAERPMGRVEKAELRSAGVLLAASAMAALRAVVGFLAFGVAFWFRHTHTPTWWFGVVLAFSTLGSLMGSAVAPIARRSMREETMLWSMLAMVTVVALIATTGGGRVSAAMLALSVGMASNFGRLAFDSIVQRDAPEANRGRSFAAFETKFQIVWVAAAFVPVVITFPGKLVFATTAGIAAFALVTYLFGTRHVRLHGAMPTPLHVHARRAAERLHAAVATDDGHPEANAAHGHEHASPGLPPPGQPLPPPAPPAPLA